MPKLSKRWNSLLKIKKALSRIFWFSNNFHISLVNGVMGIHNRHILKECIDIKRPRIPGIFLGSQQVLMFTITLKDSIALLLWMWADWAKDPAVQQFQTTYPDDPGVPQDGLRPIEPENEAGLPTRLKAGV